MHLHRTTVAPISASFVRVSFHMRLCWKQLTNNIYFFRLHEYHVASARAPNVKGALGNREVWLNIFKQFILNIFSSIFLLKILIHFKI